MLRRPVFQPSSAGEGGPLAVDEVSFKQAQTFLFSIPQKLTNARLSLVGS